MHEAVPDELGHMKSALFESTNELLRMYWKELGQVSSISKFAER